MDNFVDELIKLLKLIFGTLLATALLVVMFIPFIVQDASWDLRLAITPLTFLLGLVMESIIIGRFFLNQEVQASDIVREGDTTYSFVPTVGVTQRRMYTALIGLVLYSALFVGSIVGLIMQLGALCIVAVGLSLVCAVACLIIWNKLKRKLKAEQTKEDEQKEQEKQDKK